MKSTSLARQAVMHDTCNAPGGADCPEDECGACRFRRDPVIQKTRINKMTNQLMLSQVRLVYEYLCDEVTRCKNGSAPLSLMSNQHVLETARNGLFMVIRDTLGEGYDEGYEEKMEAVGKDEALPPSAEPKKLEEKIMDGIRRRENKAVSEMEHDLVGSPKRYCGDAMITDDIVRHSKYELGFYDLHIGPVEWMGSDNGVDSWKAHVKFRYEAYDTVLSASFVFDERGSAIANSVKAFDRMLESLPFTRLALTEKSDVESIEEA